MGIINAYAFELKKEGVRYPSETEIISKLSSHIGININFEKEKRYQAKSDDDFIYFISCPRISSEKFAIRLLLDNKQRVVIEKTDRKYSYLFHSLVYLLAQMTIDWGGGIFDSFLYDEEFEIFSEEDLTKAYTSLYLSLEDLEKAKKPFQ